MEGVRVQEADGSCEARMAEEVAACKAADGGLVRHGVGSIIIGEFGGWGQVAFRAGEVVGDRWVGREEGRRGVGVGVGAWGRHWS